jgi:V/A-type H+-transporting ATPase subunit D
MGARFPSAVECVLPSGEPRGWLPASSAVTCATVAYRDALTAAVEAAVALAAARVIDDELAATRARARALEDRWVPDLVRALAALNLALAEAESADSARLRLAVEAAAPRRPPRGRGPDVPGGRRTADDGGGEVG